MVTQPVLLTTRPDLYKNPFAITVAQLRDAKGKGRSLCYIVFQFHYRLAASNPFLHRTINSALVQLHTERAEAIRMAGGRTDVDAKQMDRQTERGGGTER